MREFVLEVVDPGTEREAISRLHRAVYPDAKFDDAIFDWRYLATPAGRASALVVRDDGEVVGMTILMAQTLTWNGERRAARVMVDVMTHPEFRGRGILRAMSARSARWGAEHETFILGYPNERSARAYLETWAAPRRVPSWEGEPRSAMSSVRVDFEPIELDELGAWVEELWSSMDCVGVQKDAAYLRWRLGRPRATYMTFAPADRSALVVLKRYDDQGGEIVLNVCELMVRPGRDDVLDAALAFAHRRATEMGAARISAWATPGGSVAAAFARAGLVPRDTGRVILWFAPGTASAAERPWHTAQLDSDVF